MTDFRWKEEPKHKPKRKRKRNPKPKPKGEKLSEDDIKELMGIKRDRYQRVKGRVRRK